VAWLNGDGRRLGSATPTAGRPGHDRDQTGQFRSRSKEIGYHIGGRTWNGIPSQLAAADYDGTTPFTGVGRSPGTFPAPWAKAAVTATFVIVPFTGLGAALWLAWGHGRNLADILLASRLLRDHPGLA